MVRARAKAQAQAGGFDIDSGAMLPQPPRHLRAEAANTDSLRLFWDPPTFDGGAPVYECVLHHSFLPSFFFFFFRSFVLSSFSFSPLSCVVIAPLTSVMSKLFVLSNVFIHCSVGTSLSTRSS